MVVIIGAATVAGSSRLTTGSAVARIISRLIEATFPITIYMLLIASAVFVFTAVIAFLYLLFIKLLLHL